MIVYDENKTYMRDVIRTRSVAGRGGHGRSRTGSLPTHERSDHMEGYGTNYELSGTPQADSIRERVKHRMAAIQPTLSGTPDLEHRMSEAVAATGQHIREQLAEIDVWLRRVPDAER